MQETAPAPSTGAAPAAFRTGAVPGRVSDCIAILRLPLILGPVLVHACLAPESSTPQYVLARVLGDLAVPVLFFVSGLLFFATWDGSPAGYRRKIVGRIRTLLPPYLAWNLVCYLVFAFALGIVARGDFLRSFWAVRVAHRAVESAPVDGPLYFVKDLFLLSLGTPVLLFGLRRRWLAWLAPAAALFWCFAPLGDFSSRAVAIGSVFFSLGGWTATRGCAPLRPFSESRAAALGAIAAFAAVSAAHAAVHGAGLDAAALHRLNRLCGIPFCFAAASFVRGRAAERLRGAGGAAMFLFCSFDIVLVALRGFVPWFRGAADGVCLAAALATVMIVAALFSGCALVSPRLLSVLTGDRQPRRRRLPCPPAGDRRSGRRED